MSMSLLFEESSLSKIVAALFGEAMDAQAAAQRVLQSGLPERCVKVVGPGDSMLEHRLEAEQGGIFRTIAMIKAPAVLGAAGLIVGLLESGLLFLGAEDFAAPSAYYTLAVGGFLGLLAGLILGGLVTLRADHTVLTTQVEEAVRGGHWAVVVRPRNRSEEWHALNVLEHSGGEVVQTP